MPITLNGTTGIQNVLGSASSPADTNTTTPTTGVYYPSATTWGVSTAGTNALYIDASQNVGIGTTSPSYKLSVNGTSVGGTVWANVNNTDTTAGSAAGVFGSNGGVNAVMYSSSNGAAGTYGMTTNHPMLFITNNTERMRIDTSGRVGIGTTSPVFALDVAGNGGAAIRGGNGFNLYNSDNTNNYYLYNSGATGSANATLLFYQGGVAERMRIDSSGNVGIGTTSTSVFKLSVNGTASFVNQLAAGNSPSVSTQGAWIGWNFSGGSGETNIINQNGGGAGGITFSQSTTANVRTEWGRFDSSGSLLVGATSNFGSVKLLVTQPNNNSSFLVNNTTASPTANTIWSNYSAAASTNYLHFYATTSGNTVANFQVLGNGNVQNANNSYGAFSDVSLKDNIVDATSKLDDLMKVQIRNYTLKNDPDKIKQIGVIAQELETVFPSIVEEIKDRDQDGKLLETTTKSVKYSVFVPMLIKAIQELKAEFDAYKAAHP